ncbi:MAG: AbrB/MazE/SpoVT family DNA-binding domain-containing protein [Clostridia bacterium]|nr:AbrB/MazE/SpoVT family DNA-binding domain-containing protein [Clostridia bacterium]
MKATGMVRRVDELGRVVLPAEIRQAMDIKVKDSLEIYTNGDAIVLQKYQQSCVFCEEGEDLVVFAQKRICPACLQKIKNQL